MPSWPGSLPQDALLPARREAQDAVLRTQMDSGPPTTRNRFTAVSKNMMVTMFLTETELQTFETFFEDTIANGALAFDWTDPLTGNTVSMKFRSPPRWEAFSGNQWQATLDLEILP